MSLAKNAQSQDETFQEEPIAGWDENLDAKDNRQPTANKKAELRLEYARISFLWHFGQKAIVKYSLHFIGYVPVDCRDESIEQIADHFDTRYYCVVWQSSATTRWKNTGQLEEELKYLNNLHLIWRHFCRWQNLEFLPIVMQKAIQLFEIFEGNVLYGNSCQRTP